jgi:multidrug efflux pump subunit AcrA (membrane-fusion protein)
MNDRRWEILIAATVFTGLGLLTGWWTAPAGAGEEAGPVAPSAPPKFPVATLSNLGVTIAKVQPTSFSRYVAVAAVVEETPFTEQPVYAPIGGQIRSISVAPGMVARAGQPLITIVRESIPRPTLTLTADILKPAQEQIHVSVVDLRKSREELRISRTELERVEKFTGNIGGKEHPILPRQVAIDLRYQLNRAEQAHELARLELTKHGISPTQIDALAAGGPIPRPTPGSGRWPTTGCGPRPPSDSTRCCPPGCSSCRG